MEYKIVTSIATPNIALTKYWGKRNKDLILPYNSSVSITLNEELKTETSVAVLPGKGEDIFYLNGVKQNVSDKDIKEQLDALKFMKELKKGAELENTHLVVYSKNYFPTAAGFASSASGIAALVYALNEAYGLGLSGKELSILARRGSGSSCRSIFGGFVEWYKGELNDGSDSYAEMLFPPSHIEDLVIIAAAIKSEQKKVSSRGGMAQTVETSKLYKLWPESVEKDTNEIIDAIRKKDLNKMYEIIMQSTDRLHAVALDTFPPIIYLNDVSFDVIYKILDFNKQEGTNVAAYTFDAGPNPFIITTKKYKEKVIDLLKNTNGVKADSIYILAPGNGPRLVKENEKSETREELEKILATLNEKSVNYV